MISRNKKRRSSIPVNGARQHRGQTGPGDAAAGCSCFWRPVVLPGVYSSLISLGSRLARIGFRLLWLLRRRAAHDARAHPGQQDLLGGVEKGACTTMVHNCLRMHYNSATRFITLGLIIFKSIAYDAHHFGTLPAIHSNPGDDAHHNLDHRRQS